MKTIKLFILPMLALALFASCSDDDDSPAPVNPPELITDVAIIFTNAADDTDVVTLTAVSADGIVEPTLNDEPPLVFTANATYNVTVTIFDNVNDENILEEIVDEVDEHFFVYATTAGFTMVRDADDPVGTLEGSSTPHKLGLETTWTAGAATTGTITVQLIHEPTSIASDVGFGAASGGEFDINQTWDVVLQ
ncbi:hypothetical protein [Winogradskyella sp.]|uniref:hypothetical protein n=1 Tax=Winogradskyella sp. TaxID=1883156 RepID=UPI002627D908|nr:hypothetical protein [Winogradskyella sp.]